MGVRVLYDVDQGMACIYDSVTGTPFGLIFHTTEEADADDRAEAFLAWLQENDGRDARMLSQIELDKRISEWLVVEEASKPRTIACSGGCGRVEVDPTAVRWTCRHCLTRRTAPNPNSTT
jgi:hypothetical protein